MSILRNKIVGIVLIVIILIGGYYAWSRGSMASFFGPRPVDVITTLVAKAGSAEIVPLVVKKYGIDKKYNLDVTFVLAFPGDLEHQYFTGTIPIANLGVQTVAAGYQQGVPTTVIGPVMPMTFEVGVLQNSPIHSMADLKGKVFGILPKATAAYSAVATVLQSAGINPQTDLTLSFGTLPELNQRLLNGEVDAAMVSYPAGASLFATGKVRSVANLEAVWEQNENGLPLPFVVIGVRDDWYATHQDIAKRYVAMWREATNMLMADPKIVNQFSDYLTATKIDSPAAIAKLDENLPSIFLSAWTQREIDGAQRFFDRFQAYGFIDNTIKAPVFIR